MDSQHCKILFITGFLFVFFFFTSQNKKEKEKRITDFSGLGPEIPARGEQGRLAGDGSQNSGCWPRD